ncbi:MAG: hypothetical protein LC772_04605 [Chloroflexi bacterium]|nr:hypothetical protein [Chloroflexota bacterium]
MLNRIARRAAIAAALMVCASSAFAQFGGGGGFRGRGGPGGGFQMSPQMMATIRAWQSWRSSHPNVAALEQTVGGLAALEQSPQTKLNRSQARSVLGVISAWRGKSSVSDQQAKRILAQLKKPLTATQLARLSEAGPGGRGGPGGFRPGGPPPVGRGGFRPGGPGGFRPGGPGGQGGFRPGGAGGFSMPSPRDYNPLNPGTSPFAHVNARMTQGMSQRLNGLLSALKASAR